MRMIWREERKRRMGDRWERNRIRGRREGKRILERRKRNRRV